MGALYVFSQQDYNTVPNNNILINLFQTFQMVKWTWWTVSFISPLNVIHPLMYELNPSFRGTCLVELHIPCKQTQSFLDDEIKIYGICQFHLELETLKSKANFGSQMLTFTWMADQKI